MRFGRTFTGSNPAFRRKFEEALLWWLWNYPTLCNMLVPNTIKGMAFGTRVLTYWVFVETCTLSGGKATSKQDQHGNCPHHRYPNLLPLETPAYTPDGKRTCIVMKPTHVCSTKSSTTHDLTSSRGHLQTGAYELLLVEQKCRSWNNRRPSGKTFFIASLSWYRLGFGRVPCLRPPGLDEIQRLDILWLSAANSNHIYIDR